MVQYQYITVSVEDLAVRNYVFGAVRGMGTGRTDDHQHEIR